ncbi:hypothetical protein [Shewanella halifaxensis]|uniref:hypothetical protein n=1 Tax=Shewanella halifaxensis TaxID=271098 RepID=UPI000D59699C|nr:hypothetical protein [Shewanella halifaxensis]
MARKRTMVLVTTGEQRNGVVVTKEMLDSAVSNYVAHARPPIIQGHVKKDEAAPVENDTQQCSVPAWGRVDTPLVVASKKHSGEWDLVVTLVYTKQLEAMEDSLEFEGFSIGLFPLASGKGWYIHHVAILGSLPPAAETQTLEVVNLSATHAQINHAVYLSAPIPSKGKKMDEEEIKALVATQTAEALKTVLPTALADALIAAGITPSDGKPDGEGGDKDKTTVVESDETKALKAQVAQMQETTKAARVEEIKALAEQKGMSEAESKPILDSLANAEAVQLCDNSATGLYATMKSVVGARADKPTHNPLLQSLPINLSNEQGVQVKINLADVAAETGF